MGVFLPIRSAAPSYRLGNKRGENVRKLGRNVSGNCQECQEFSTIQKSGHPVSTDDGLDFAIGDAFEIVARCPTDTSSHTIVFVSIIINV